MNCILCNTSEVYDVLQNDRAGKMYVGGDNSNPNDYVHLTRLHDKRPHIPTYILYYSV